MSKGKLVRLSKLVPVCPPRHLKTDAFPLITGSTVGAEHIEFFLVEIEPGGEGEEDVHPTSEHGFFVISGNGEAFVEGQRFALRPDDCLYIPAGARHSVKPLGGQSLRFLVFMAPPRPAG